MSGEVKAYSLNSPMTREQFLEMPNDLKAVYIKAIRKKYGTPDSVIAKAMGFSQQAFSNNVIAKLGIRNGKTRGGNTKWDKEGFFAWWNGVDKLPTPVPEEDPIQEEEDVQQEEEPESFVEDDLPWNVPETVPEVKFVVNQCQTIPQTACPNTGSLSFKCPASMALNTLKELLQNEMVAINITWRVIEEGGDDNG